MTITLSLSPFWYGFILGMPAGIVVGAVIVFLVAAWGMRNAFNNV